MANNPTNYKPNLPRVSSIVEFAFPFEGDGKERFLGWLEAKWVSLEDYMEEACTGGTYVHKALENYGNTWVWRGKKYKGFVEAWIQFLKDYKVEVIAQEKYTSTKDYQWTIDLIGKLTFSWETYILDWKSYWLAKTKYWLEPKEYRKPYDKLKKARLQLSLYAYSEKIKNIAIIELLATWEYKFHKLDIIPKKEINSLLKQYKLRYGDEI